MKEQDKITENSDEKPKAVPESQLATEYLANERTFLAWVRTAIAVISLGFVVAKFGLWMEELAANSSEFSQFRTGISLPIGTAMIFFGGFLTVLAAWRYKVVNQKIKDGSITADHSLVYAITLIVVALSLAIIIYMIISVRHS